jgi:conjugal transfer pilus assembly protein TraD
MTSYINHFRPIYESRAAVFWLATLLIVPLSGMPYGWAFALLALLALLLRSAQVWRALKFRMAISTKWLTTIQVPKLLTLQKRMKAEANSMYLGIGFEWTQKHCQIAHDILRMPAPDIPGGLPKWLSRTRQGRQIEAAIEGIFAPKDSIRDRMPQGSSWIHGMEPKKGLVPFHGDGRAYARGRHDRCGQDAHLRGHLDPGDSPPRRPHHCRPQERRRVEAAR